MQQTTTHTGTGQAHRLYGTGPIKRKRRNASSMNDLLDAVRDELDRAAERITIRHLFYRLSGRGAIEKTEHAYRNLCAHLAKWRKAGELSFGAFVDGTRWYYGDSGFDTLEEALRTCAQTYRKNVWLDSPHHLEVWVEKETIASLLTRAASPWGVQVFVCRGFASLSSLYDAAEAWKTHVEMGRTVTVLYFGDHDPSGLRIDASAASTMRNTFGVAVDFRRVAVLPEHILEFNLPTRPTKAHSSHAAGFKGESVEIDAMEPAQIRAIAQGHIESFIDPHTLCSVKAAEKAERDTIYALADIAVAEVQP